MVCCPDCGSAVAFPARYCTRCGSYLPEAQACNPSPQGYRVADEKPMTSSVPATPFTPAPSTSSMPAPVARSHKHARTLVGFALPHESGMNGDQDEEARGAPIIDEMDAPSTARWGASAAAKPSLPPQAEDPGAFHADSPRAGSPRADSPWPDPLSPGSHYVSLNAGSVHVGAPTAAQRRPMHYPSRYGVAESSPDRPAWDSTVQPPHAVPQGPPTEGGRLGAENASVTVEPSQPAPTSLSRFFFYPHQQNETPGDTGASASSAWPGGALRAKRRRKTGFLKWMLVGAVLACGAVLLAYPRPAPALKSKLGLDIAGRQILAVECVRCTKVSAVSIDGVFASFQSGQARLSPAVALPPGESTLVAALHGPDGRVKYTKPLQVQVPLRLAPDASLERDVPVLRWQVQTAPGVTLRIDGKPVDADDTGVATYDVDVSQECVGLSAERTVAARTIHYVAYRGDLPIDEGEEATSAPILPLEASFGAATSRDVVLSGRTLDGARIFLNGVPVSVKGGSFEQTVAVAAAADAQLLATMNGFLPRRAQLTFREATQGRANVRVGQRGAR